VQKVRLRNAVGRRQTDEPRFAFGERPGLVDDERVDFPENLDRLLVFVI
jgi:hypothetical protein